MKKYKVFITLCIITSIGIISTGHKNKDNSISKEENIVEKNNMISMMLETESGSGKYTLSTSDSFPQEKYILNTNLSRCENGGTLSWNNETKKLILKGNISDKCYAYFDKYEPPITLVNYVKSLYTGTQGENGLYYHDSNLENGAEDNSYRYAGGDYILTDAGKLTGALNIFTIDETDTTGLIDFYCNDKKRYYNYSCTSEDPYYFIIKNNTKQYSSYNEVIDAALKLEYIRGDQINNYVCFGSDESICPENNLYRIIGVFDEKVKLIKADYVGDDSLGTDGDFSISSTNLKSTYRGMLTDVKLFYWNYMNETNINRDYGSNIWSTSLLNKTNLNTNFFNSFTTKYKNVIIESIWKTGGNTVQSIRDGIPSLAYKGEIINPVPTNTKEAEIENTGKIGLPYVTDYYFAAQQDKWSLKGHSTDDQDYSTTLNVNWMFMGLQEWTITRVAGESTRSYSISPSGIIDSRYDKYAYAIRSTFYIDTSVLKIAGNETKSSPFRIS